MKLKVDREVDALYLGLSEEPASKSEEISVGIIVDYNRKGQTVGIEKLHLSKRASDANIRKFLYKSVPLNH